MFKGKNGVVLLSGGLLLTGTLLLTGCTTQMTWGQGPSPDPTPTTSATPAPEEDQEPTTLEEANDLITVDAPPSALSDWNYPARYTTLVKQEKFDTETINDQEIPVLKMGSLQGDDEVLDTTAWPDATGPALIENSARGIVVATLVYADNCAMDAVGLQSVVFHTAFGDVSVLENNPWLAEYFPADPKKINDWGGAAVNGSDEERLEAAKLCAHVGAIWEQLTDMGVMENITTELNYHVKPADSIKINFGAPFTTAREFELNPVQYTDSFVVLEFILKGQPSVCENRILKNPGDGRFARPYCPPPTVEEDCVSGCVVIEECPEGQVRNEYGKCVVPKDGGSDDYVYAPYVPPAPVTPVTPKPDVITVIPDDDTTDESAKSDGTVSE